MKRFKDFLIEKKNNLWVYNGEFKVTHHMVSKGSLVKEKIPDQVNGDFFCTHKKLTTLKGCPTTISGDFICYNNKLTSLEGCPSKVKGFYCHNNILTSLKGCPDVINGDFICFNNKLTSLEWCPIIISGQFDFSDNLLDLEIERDFIKSGSYSIQSNYWSDLFKYMIKKKIDLNKITTWPDSFIQTLDYKYKNMLKSYKVINKFNL